MVSNFLLGEEYIFKSKASGKTFKGKLVNRKYGLGQAFKGRVVGENKPCHLPLVNVLSEHTTWELVKEQENGK